METLSKEINTITPSLEKSNAFIGANTFETGLLNLKQDCIIPVFSKDNESTISHVEFIDTAMDVVNHFFRGEQIAEPQIRVSHPIKGRIPEAMGKPAAQLLESEKTIYYERMAFVTEIPSIQMVVDGNPLALTVGGVRSYNLENLFGKKSPERFKFFIGFKNSVCCNLCISTDGLKVDLKAGTPTELGSNIYDLFHQFDLNQTIGNYKELPNYAITEQQFANLIGRMKMYSSLPKSKKNGIPELLLTESMLSSIVDDYYNDPKFKSLPDGGVTLWNLYNYFTEASKGSYIDSFLERTGNSLEMVNHLKDAVKQECYSWYLN